MSELKEYFFDQNSGDSGEHLVYCTDCSDLPVESDRVILGQFADCQAALVAAAKHYPSFHFDCRQCP